MRPFGKVFQASVLMVLCLGALCYLADCNFDCSKVDSIRLGEIRFDNPGFFPFKGGEQFIFVNKQGDELSFFDSAKNEMNYKRMDMRQLCYHPPLGVPASTFYDCEHYYFEYPGQDRSAFIIYDYTINNEKIIRTTDADTVLFDEFSMSFFSKESDASHTYSIDYVVSDRGNMLKPITTTNTAYTRIIKDTTVNGNHYTNLFCPKNNPGMFYSTAYGLVLFNYKNDWWYLKR